MFHSIWVYSSIRGMEKSVLISRLDACENLKEVATEAGVNYQTLHNFKAGRTSKMSPARTARVIAALAKLEKRHAATKVERITYIRVEEDGRAKLQGDNPMQPFNADVLERITPAPAESLLMVFVENESMSPTFLKGDQVLIDTTVSRITSDGLYYLDIGGGERIFRRCSLDFESGQIMVQSDNLAFKNARLTDPRKLKIAGRAIWYGRFIG